MHHRLDSTSVRRTTAGLATAKAAVQRAKLNVDHAAVRKCRLQGE